MVIVDSSVWIDYLRGVHNSQTAWLDNSIGQLDIGITGLILCEVLQGVRNEPMFLRVCDYLSRYEVFETGGVGLSVASARNYLALRQRGFAIRSTIDCFIATFCIEEGHTLLHRDRDFDLFESHLGLQVLHPPEHLLQ